MEQSRTALRGSATAGNQPGSILALQKETDLSPERVQQQIIYDESIKIACDWLEATGEPVTDEEFLRLFEAGYSSYPPSKVTEVFYDWEDYQEVSQSYYEDSDTKAQKEWELYQTLYQEAQSGLMPIELFLRVESYKIDNPHSERKPLLRYKITGDYELSSVVLDRYYKYLLVEHLLESRPSDIESTEERKIGMVLGFTQSTGKPLSSFIGRLKNSYTGITDQDIQEVAEELDIYEKVFPECRREHLDELVELGRGRPEPEYYYDAASKKIIVLGRLALDSFKQTEGRNHLERLSKGQKLLIGQAAISAFNREGAAQEISKLGDLLRSGVPESFPKGHMRTMDLTRDDFIEIGRWISSIVTPAETPSHMHLNEAVFMNAKHLGIGFSINKGSRLMNEFASMGEYYQALGQGRANRKGVTDMEEAVNTLIALSTRLGRRPSYRELVKAHRDNPAVPHPLTINRRLSTDQRTGLDLIFDAAGLPKRRLGWDSDDCLNWGLNFIRKTGKVPREKDIDKASKKGTAASKNTFKKHFGLLSEFNAQVRELYLETASELKDVAA